MPSYRIGNSQTHLRISWLPPIALCPLKLARLWLFSHKLNSTRRVEAFTKQATVCLALSHDGLWVFANRIFAHRVLADWRRRRRGRLLARQISGSGNAQHGDEPSRYDYDDLHDANPLVLGTRTGRPSDAPIPLCLCETPAFTIPCSGSIAGGKWLPTICRFGDGMVQMRLGGSGRTQINQMTPAWSAAMPKSRFIATILLLGPSLRVSNSRRHAECAPRLPSERRRSRSPHGTAVDGNQTHLPASATNEVVELGTARVSAFLGRAPLDMKIT